MSNPLQKTPIIDVNGHATTRNKRVDGGAVNNSRIKNVGAPITTGSVRATYKAPNHPELQKEVRYNGNVMTWGAVLESINPPGFRRTVPFGEKRWVHSAVHANDTSKSVIVPAAVIKASGLEDISDPIMIADGELVVANVKWEKALAAIPAHLYGSTSVSKWHEAAEEQRKVVDAAQNKVDFLRREQARDDIESSGIPVENMLYDTNGAGKYKAEAMLDIAVDNGDTELVKKIANSNVIRKYLGKDYRDGLIGHPNPAVRGAFVEGNLSLSSNQIKDVADHDTDAFVVSVAKANLAMRKATGYKG